mmetsp:Transcript_6385/g.14191  ORF Transcript_6385/g.14191 Transcript_6385/m.14191 type:complete len:479 (+) Transcript_6385:89-1525(+)|eukprot:CAMPEP_0202891848 /NCGR_PEP_ID=MMETSP1392-20130828/1793_1 /ASSEMBLY_ACC=CAM_ASM_000868 /TAXON_ID=225041 /ORGANISM="Chlamydomonas chlamydogama, Strain SAG 11-48b" /LENGTH=478 /DNA_ID=CAMNT_0049575709 /DNA_START=85 /DNA_END=1521 /DNA_ORIENTATION=+
MPGVPSDKDGSSNAAPSNGNAAHALAAKRAFEKLLDAIATNNKRNFLSASRSVEGGVEGILDTYGRNVLHYAAQQGRLELVKIMVDDMDFKINFQDSKGETALALAAATGHVDVVKYLLSKGGNPTLRQEPDGTAAIHRAATCKQLEVIDVLLEAQADVNTPSKTGTPLCWAAGAGLPDNVDKLLKAGAGVNPSQDHQVSPLLLAAACACQRSVQLLLDAGANPSYVGHGGSTALHAVAAVEGEQGSLRSVASTLLQAGADPNVEDVDGHTALFVAAARGHRALVELLLPATKPGSGRIAADDWTVEGVMKQVQEQVRAASSSGASGSGSAPAAGPGQQVVAIPEPEELDEEKAATSKRAGDEAFVKRDFETAVERYSESLRHATKNHLVWANRSAAYLKLGKAAEALHDARISRVLSPGYVKAWFREGSAYAALRLWEDAACAFFEGYNLEPSNKEVSDAFHNAIAEGRKEHAASQK